MPGPKGLLQEKFQRTAEQEKPEDHEWANPSSFGDKFSIRKVYQQSKSLFYGSDETGAPDQGSFYDAKFNKMPPGMFIDNAEPMVTEHPFKYVAAGESDVSNRVDATMMKHGFKPNQMSPVDDMYNNEHVEEFYGEAHGEDDAGNKITGFLERNNYLDRS